MNKKSISRRMFTTTAAGLLVSAPTICLGQEPNQEEKKQAEKQDDKPAGPVESPFERDYEEPKFKPSWKNPQINRTMAADFVIFAHSDLEKTKMLLDREPGLLNAAMDWGAGDYETALGGASHMGEKEIVKFLLGKGARIDIFCATMLGMLETVKEMLAFEPELINARGPHGVFDLYWHAQIGLDAAQPVLDHLLSIKKVELKTNHPLIKRRRAAEKKKKDQ